MVIAHRCYSADLGCNQWFFGVLVGFFQWSLASLSILTSDLWHEQSIFLLTGYFLSLGPLSVIVCDGNPSRSAAVGETLRPAAHLRTTNNVHHVQRHFSLFSDVDFELQRVVFTTSVWLNEFMSAYLHVTASPLSVCMTCSQTNMLPMSYFFFQVFRQRGLRGRSLIAVSLRQLYPALRLYANSLHPIRQQGNQWSPLASSKRATFLPLFPGERPDLRGGQGKGMMLSIFFIEEVSSNTFSRLSVKFQRAHAACVRACTFGCHWPIVTQWDSPGLCVRLSFFELLSLFNSSCCGRVGEKWEIDWGCAKSQAWF